MLINELLPKYLPNRSINPAKIQPVDENGDEVADGHVLTYDATLGFAVFKL
jgi:hypothetical protein